MRRLLGLTIAATTAAAVAISIPLLAQQRGGGAAPRPRPAPAAVPDQWPNSQANSNFSPLTQITPENVSRLTQAWSFSYGAGSQPAGSLGLDFRFEIQPLLIGGVMYVSTPGSPSKPDLKSTVTAIEPETGKVLWQHTSERNIHGRGLAYWKGSGTVGGRLYFATDKAYLVALDLKTGEVASGFGNKGEVDLFSGVASSAVPASARDTFTVPNPVAVFKNLLISGARPGEGEPPQPRGDIRAWDAVTGKLVWSFHTIPQPGEPFHEEWPGDTWKDRSGCNVWGNMTADETSGLVFATTGESNHADTSPGRNLYCNSIVALDGATGKLKWFHQLVHHDVWDMDMPTPPILVDVKRDARTIPALLVTGKMNYVYVFDRATGVPFYGIEDRPVRRSDDPDDQSWPVQPFPLKPGPIGRVGMTRDDISKLTPEIEKFCTEFWDSRNIQPSTAYMRPITGVSYIRFPSSVGGPNWGPLSYNPALGYVFISLHNTGSLQTGRVPGASGVVGAGGGRGAAAGGATPPPAGAGTPAAGGRRGGGGGGGGFVYTLPSGKTAPCWAPPYGALVAINVNTGDIAWTSTLGINENLAELGDLGLKTGTRNLGGSIATASGLVFIGATNDRRFRAFDAKDGKELWVAELPASGHSTPITYMGKDGAQYVVIPASGGTSIGGGLPISDQLVAFKLGPPK